MANLKPNKARAKAAIIMIWVVMGLEIISLISGYLQYILLSNFEVGIYVTPTEANANDLREQLIAVVYIIVFIISAVTFIKWFRRAYFNLHQKVNYLSFDDGWASGGWFVPFLNWIRPVQIMNELYKYTPEYLATKNVSTTNKLQRWTVGVWWTLWVINSIIGNIVTQLSLRAEEIDEFIKITNFSMIGNIIGIPLAIITVKVISDYSKVETLLYESEELDNNEVQNSFNIGISSTLLDD